MNVVKLFSIIARKDRDFINSLDGAFTVGILIFRLIRNECLKIALNYCRKRL
jgi:hypothetical protein